MWWGLYRSKKETGRFVDCIDVVCDADLIEDGLFLHILAAVGAACYTVQPTLVWAWLFAHKSQILFALAVCLGFWIIIYPNSTLAELLLSCWFSGFS